MGIAEALDHEWARVSQTSVAGRALRRWARAWPALGDCRDLGHLLELRRDGERAQELLYPLAMLSPSDELAARTLLQALLPGLVSMAAAMTPREPTALDELLGLAWERIRTYPSTREGSVAGNVLLDVRKRFARARVGGSRVIPICAWAEPAVEDALNFDRATVLGLLREGRERGVLEDDDLELIVRTRMFDVPIAEVAADHGEDAKSLGRRRWRAEEALRRMVLDDGHQVIPWSAA